MKKKVQTDPRVVVYPRSLGDLGVVSLSDRMVSTDIDGDYKKRCDEIVADIKRHVNNVGAVYIQYDTAFVCSFCGEEWYLSKDDGLPNCCIAAYEEALNSIKGEQ